MPISSLISFVTRRKGLRSRTKPLDELKLIPQDKVKIYKEMHLGSGSFGRVYLGMLYGELVAIKEPKQALVCPKCWKAFMHEVSVLERGSHQNVISFRGFCMDPPCIITEYCPNGSLYDLLQSQEYERFGWPSRLELALGVARGMMFLHCQKRPIIHRDLKSSNVVLKKDNTPVITDLGLSGTIPQEHLEDMLPTWQAPEVVGDGKEATLKSDVYSFAIIMWEILTGDHPWKDVHPWAVLYQITQGNRPSIPEDLPDDWVGLKEYLNLMEHCWAHDPSQRPTFKDIYEELENIAYDAGLERCSNATFESVTSLSQDSNGTRKKHSSRFKSFFMCQSF